MNKPEFLHVRKQTGQPLYKHECMMGAEHPLQIEQYKYILTQVYSVHISDQRTVDNLYGDGYGTKELIDDITRKRPIQWAIDNSFDGLYVDNFTEVTNMRTNLKFYVYLLDKHATFWNLKFGQDRTNW